MKNVYALIVAALVASFFIPNIQASEKKKMIKIEYNDHGKGAWLGIQIKDLDRGMKKELDTSANYGAVVDNVLDDTPAAVAGLEPGDVIIKLNNKLIRRTDDLTDELAEYKPEDKIKLEYIRGMETHTVDIVLAKKPKDSFQFLTHYHNFLEHFHCTEQILGMELKELDDHLAGYFKVKADEGLLVTDVLHGSPAEKSGILAGDIIVAINGKNISRAEDLEVLMKDVEEGDEVTVAEIRHGEKKEFTLKIEENPQPLAKPYLHILNSMPNFKIEKDIMIDKNEDAIRRYKEKMNSWRKEYQNEVEEMIKNEIEKSQLKRQFEMQALQEEMKRMQDELEAMKARLNSR